MSEFARAVERAEKRRAKRGLPIEGIFLEPTKVDIPVPKIKTPKKRSNEINVSVWLDGEEYKYSFRTNIGGTILSSQQNDDGIKRLIVEALKVKFGTLEPL